MGQHARKQSEGRWSAKACECASKRACVQAGAQPVSRQTSALGGATLSRQKFRLNLEPAAQTQSEYSRNEDEDADNNQLHLHILPPHAAAQLPASLVELVRL